MIEGVVTMDGSVSGYGNVEIQRTITAPSAGAVIKSNISSIFKCEWIQMLCSSFANPPHASAPVGNVKRLISINHAKTFQKSA